MSQLVSTITGAGEPTRWLSTAEAARRCEVTVRTLYGFIDRGELPAYRFGRVIRLKTGDVDVFVESCRLAPGSLDHLLPSTDDGDSTDGDGPGAPY